MAWQVTHLTRTSPRAKCRDGGGGAVQRVKESLREMHLQATFIGLFANEKLPSSLEAGFGYGALLADSSAPPTRAASYGFGLIHNADTRGVMHVRH